MNMQVLAEGIPQLEFKQFLIEKWDFKFTA
jgi:hypothetical protein